MKRIAAVALSLALSALAPAAAFAQAWPAKPIRAIVGFPSGGSADTAVRAAVNDMSTRLGQSMVVDSRPGATGMIALDAVKDAPPDGYTIGLLATPTIVASILAGRAVSNPAAAFTPIGYIWQAGLSITVNPAAPYMANVSTLRDLVAAAKANPGKIYYSSAGTGSSGHLLGVLLATSTGMDWSHVGYKGLAPATTDFMAGRISVIMGSVLNDLQLIKEGKLRVVANTAPAREPKYPDVPTVAEAGFPDLVFTSWGGLVGPGGLPKPVAERLSSELKTSMAKQEVQRVVTTMSVPYTGSVDEFYKRYVADYDILARVVKVADIKME
ncbi:MAG TPA: tripartite tricarboxylate transporter substrate binding protein [Burkholderiales bacterium]|nr:tripartite tricarboxylate transporter substrate binding protein [Burkholderiales bacterium]